MCVVPFVDTTPSDWFYEYVQYLYCKGVINGYNTNPPCEAGTPCFKPENPTTRGQLAKIVVLAFDFTIDTTGGPSFQDVPEGSTFYPYVETAKSLGLISGYACGGPGEPCVGPDDKPYYRAGRSVTRGQITKIVVSAAILANPEHWTLLNPADNTFEDVPVGSTFFEYVETAAAHGVINGYPCGSAPAGECVPPGNKPYFLPSDNASRAQISKVVYLGVTISARK
jgi:S-layer homology domain